MTTFGAQSLERPLPSSEEAERAILGAIILDQSLISACIGQVTPDDFYKPLHKQVYAGMLSLFERGVTIDPITISEDLKKDGASLEAIGGIETIANLSFGLPHYTNIDPYILIVKTKSRARKLVQICNFSTGESLGEETDFPEVLDRHEQLISELRNKDTANHFVTLRTSLEATVQQIGNFAKSGGKDLLGITTGYKEIDALTSGLEKSDLIILGARPSMGKTALALQICKKAAASSRDPEMVVPIFSLEMAENQLTQRMIAAEASVDLMRLRRGMLTNPEWTRVSIATESLADLNIVIDDTPAVTTMQIKAKIRRLLSERKHIGLVMVDHGGLVKHDGDHRVSEHLKITQIMKDFKAMAKEFDIPFLVLYQLSRKVEERKPPRPMMQDLRESGSIEEIADKIFFIYRPEYYLKDECPEDSRGIAEIIIAKNRNGPTETIKLAFLKQFGRFEDAYLG